MGLLRVRFRDKTKATSDKTVHGTPELSGANDTWKDTSQWKDQDTDIEMEDLFRKAVSSERHASGFDRAKRDSSMLKKLMRCKGHQNPLDEFSDKIRRNLLAPKRCDGENGHFMTPDVVSERGYDSDAQCISTPRISDRSPGSARTTNLLEPINSRSTSKTNQSDRYERSLTAKAGNETPCSAGAGIQYYVEERIDCATPSPHRWRQTPVCETETSNTPSATPRRSSSLVVPKRRNARDSPSLNAQHRSFCAADTIQEHAKVFVVKRNTTTQSKFTERFELSNLACPVHLRDPKTGNSRRVSVAWMSDGRRFGYGYSFVHNDEDGDTTHDVSSMAESHPGGIDTTSGGQQQDLQNQEPIKGKISERLGEAQSPQSSEHGEAFGDRTSRFSLWSRFPSHTRADRNGPATFKDDVIVRNFYAGPSPETDARGDAEKKKFQPAAKQKDRNFIRQWAKPSGRQGIEVLRYRAGLTVDAARSRVSKLPELEIFPFWPHAHKEELGDHEKEIKRARKGTQGFDGHQDDMTKTSSQHESTKENFPGVEGIQDSSRRLDRKKQSLHSM
ncbi:hypothetical protein VTN77DRAFT_1214 [Rasamsonia byssochlamydoides]|uniref:uncharacterized protein n=1 Tax=Rasamsonia byssochlamydoides TaxID=89139 RepID=UPI003742A910